CRACTGAGQRHPSVPGRLTGAGSPALLHSGADHISPTVPENAMSTHVTQPTPPVSGARAVWNRTDAIRPAYAFILPVLVLFVIFRTWPAFNGFLLSFQDYRLTGDCSWLGLEHYRYLLQDDLFWHSLRVTMV